MRTLHPLLDPPPVSPERFGCLASRVGAVLRSSADVLLLQGEAAIAKAHGALVVVDAVASVAAEPLDVDGWGIDICVIGPQKAMAGPPGISAVLVGQAAWTWVEANPGAPSHSALSLLDWRTGWIEADRRSIPVVPLPLEVAALEAALERLDERASGEDPLAASAMRHRAAAAASRAILAPLGLRPWVGRAGDAAAVVTTIARPPGMELGEGARARLAGAAVSLGAGELAGQLLRIDHTGTRASLDVVLAAVDALADALGSSSAAVDVATHEARSTHASTLAAGVRIEGSAVKSAARSDQREQ